MYDTNNIFARILRKEIPASFIYEDDICVAFPDIDPKRKKHILVITKGAYLSFNDFIEKASHQDVSSFWKSVQQIAKQEGLDRTGYRLITNHGEDSGQEVPHFHVHILGGEPVGGLTNL